MRKDISMYGYIKNSVQNPNDIKISFGNNDISAKKMFADIDAVSTFLYDKGIRAGDCVGICLPNIPQAVIALYAINKLGAVANTIHPNLRDEALYATLKKTKTKIIFMYDYNVIKHRDAILKEGIIIVSCSYSDYLKGFAKIVKLSEPVYLKKGIYTFKHTLRKTKDMDIAVDPKADAVLLHSSGTFGESKTVRLSSNAFNYLSDNLEEMLCVDNGIEIPVTDSMLMILPFFHGFGLGICAHFPLHLCKVIMVPFFSPKKIAKIIETKKVNMSAAVPSMLAHMLKEPAFDNPSLKNIKILFSGGDKISQKLKEDFDAILAKNGSKCKIMEGYGLSELASAVSVNTSPALNNSQGYPFPNVDIQIITDGQIQPAETVGEICIDSPSVMNGYLDNTSPEFTLINGHNYLHSGDHGYKDKDGFVYFKDRLKRIIIIGGINVYPQEVERVINNIEGVKNCCVARVMEGKMHTKVYLQLDAGVTFNAKMQAKIEKTVAGQIIKYAVPTEFEQVEALKYNEMGKVNFLAYEKLLKKE